MDLKGLEMLQIKERRIKYIGEVQDLLGFLGYYHSFIQDFSRIAWPLFKIQVHPVPSNKNAAVAKSTQIGKSSGLLPYGAPVK